MATVYFVRHGQSKDNIARVHQGFKSPLTSLGKKQARIVANRLKKLHIDVIYASPFIRAKQTAQIISEVLKKPIEFWEDIQEIPNPTELVGQYYKTKRAKRIRKIKKEKEIDPNWKYSDEESFNEQKQRGLKVLKHIEEKHKNQVVVCVSHGTLVRIILALIVFGEDLKTKEYHAIRDTLKIGNTGITKCRYFDKGDFKDGWKIFSVNDMPYL